MRHRTISFTTRASNFRRVERVIYVGNGLRNWSNGELKVVHAWEIQENTFMAFLCTPRFAKRRNMFS